MEIPLGERNKDEIKLQKNFLLAGIKKFIDTSRFKRIVSEETAAGALKKMFLKTTFLKFAW